MWREDIANRINTFNPDELEEFNKSIKICEKVLDHCYFDIIKWTNMQSYLDKKYIIMLNILEPKFDEFTKIIGMDSFNNVNVNWIVKRVEFNDGVIKYAIFYNYYAHHISAKKIFHLNYHDARFCACFISGLVHELRHVQQYEGLVDGMSFEHSELIRLEKDYSYTNDPYEVDAFKYEEEICAKHMKEIVNCIKKIFIEIGKDSE